MSAESQIEILINYYSKGNLAINRKLLKHSTISKIESNAEFFNLERDNDKIKQEKLMEIQITNHF